MLLVSGRFCDSKTIIPEAQEHFLTPSARRDTHPFGGLGFSQVTAALRKTVSEAHGCLIEERDREVAELEASDLWLQLTPGDGERILGSHGLGPISSLDIGTDLALMDCLDNMGIEDWNVRLLALNTRVNQARKEAAQLLAPEAVTLRPTPATLHTREEVEAYISKLREQLLAQVDEHPVIIS